MEEGESAPRVVVGLIPCGTHPLDRRWFAGVRLRALLIGADWVLAVIAVSSHTHAAAAIGTLRGSSDGYQRAAAACSVCSSQLTEVQFPKLPVQLCGNAEAAHRESSSARILAILIFIFRSSFSGLSL